MKKDLAQAYLLINQREMQSKPLVGISACLCGEPVRYDAKNKGLPNLTQTLEKQLTLLKVCPEVAIGMGVPRQPIQLTLNQGGIEARGVENPSHHVTVDLQNYAQSFLECHSPVNPDNDVLCGFILKSRSPSCGAGSTPIYENNRQINVGNGIFSQQLQKRLPWLPVVEEEALTEPQQQMTFIIKSQLVRLFWQTTRHETNGVTAFHEKINALFEIFPATLKSELEQLVCEAVNKASPLYLIRLMQALQAT